LQPFAPARLLAMPDTALKAAGLSRVKIETLRRLGAAVDSGTVNVGVLARAKDEVIHAKLILIKGIGPWTADIYIMFSLARADAWSPGDLALQHAVKDALRLEARPGPNEMVTLAEAWRPWRAVAARLLWSYYSHQRKRTPAPLGREAQA
jgi:DNA-3-methyladenine glycosylase II